MSHSLDDAHAKMNRARKHLDELQASIYGHGDSHRYAIVPENEVDTGRVRYILRALDPEEPIPLSISAIAGDLAHNIRAALDCLVWQLAEAGTGGDEQTQFPIVFDETGKTYRSDPPTRYRDAERRRLRGVPSRYWAFFERVQPYHGGHRELLAFVALLDNADKHRVVPATRVIAINPHPIPNPTLSGMVIRTQSQVAVKDGAEMFSITVPPRFLGPVEMELYPPIQVLFGPSVGRKSYNISYFFRAIRYGELILSVFRNVPEFR